MTFPIVIEFPLHWGEMDALGHVNNARLFTWFESARIALFRRVGILTSGPSSIGPILARATCDFHEPIVYPADIAVGVRVSGVGNTSVTMDYAAWLRGAPHAPCARGTSVAVLIDYATKAKVRVPEEVRAAIAALG